MNDATKTEQKMAPIIILPIDGMAKEDIERLRSNGLCVVEAREPALVKFMDPIPAVVGRTAVEDAAIQLSRTLLRPHFWNNDETRKTVATEYVDILVKGTKLDPRKSKKELGDEIFDGAKADELRLLAREEAKAERAAKKKEKEAAKASKPAADKSP